jgi:hypothetical protein
VATEILLNVNNDAFNVLITYADVSTVHVVTVYPTTRQVFSLWLRLPFQPPAPPACLSQRDKVQRATRCKGSINPSICPSITWICTDGYSCY